MIFQGQTYKYFSFLVVPYSCCVNQDIYSVPDLVFYHTSARLEYTVERRICLLRELSTIYSNKYVFQSWDVKLKVQDLRSRFNGKNSGVPNKMPSNRGGCKPDAQIFINDQRSTLDF